MRAMSAAATPPNEERPGADPDDRPSRPAVSPRLLVVLAIVLAWAFFFATGLGGIEYGEHWDEDRLMLSTYRAIGTGSFRPSFYVYPTVTHWLAWLPAIPTLLAGFPAAKACLDTVDPTIPSAWTPCLTQWTEHAVAALTLKSILLRARILFLLASSTAVVFTGLSVWKRRRRPGEAALATGVVAFSWQVAYHARWTAPDALLMAAAALLLWVLDEAERRKSDRLLRAAAAVAALGASTKLTGGILLLPVLLVGAFAPREGRLLPSLDKARAARLMATFAAAFCLTSPGFLVDLPQVVLEILHESRHYATGYGAYSVSPGPLHLFKMIVYLLGPLLSPRWPLGFILGALAIAGARAAYRDESRAVRAFLVTAAVYLLYLSLQRVMIARNLIWLAPLLAACVARGVTFAADSVPRRLPQNLVAAPTLAAVIILALNAAYTADAAARVPERQQDGLPARAVAVMLENPGQRFYLSEGARARFHAAGTPTPPNAVARPEEADYVIGLLAEIPTDGVPANNPGTFALGLTAPDLDLDAYPTPLDRDRFVALRARAWAAAAAKRPHP